MKISAYAAAYSHMHFGATFFLQTQELEAHLLTVLHLPPRCGINR